MTSVHLFPGSSGAGSWLIASIVLLLIGALTMLMWGLPWAH
jgi:hypothetical protein